MNPANNPYAPPAGATELPYFYFYSCEIYDRRGCLKSKHHGTVRRASLIVDGEFQPFLNLIKTSNKLAETDQIHLVSISRLNA